MYLIVDIEFLFIILSGYISHFILIFIEILREFCHNVLFFSVNVLHVFEKI